MIEIADADVFASGRAESVFRLLRSKHPVHYHPHHRFGPYWSLTRYADVLAAEMHPQDFSSADGITDVDWDPAFALDMFIATDGVRHRELRSTAASMMSGGAIASLRSDVADEINRRLTSLPLGEPIDCVSELATPIARAVARSLFSLSENEISDLERLTALAHGTGPFVEVSVRERMRLLRAHAGRVAGSGLRDVAEKLGEGPMGILGNAIFLASASLETIRAAISASIIAQHTYQDESDLIYKQIDCIDLFVSEVLRWHPPLAYMRRTTTRDLTVRNSFIPARSKVLLWYASANRDEEMFERSNKINILRTSPHKSLAFGAGPHHCLGRKLAEIVIGAVWFSIVSRGYQIEVIGHPRRMRSYFVHGFDSIPSKIILKT